MKRKYNTHDPILLDNKYKKHKTFRQLTKYISFYKYWSFLIMGLVSPGTRAVINIDTYVFTSIHDTLESIRYILRRGRISDAYTLLRRYYDTTFINIYYNLYLDDHFDINNYIVVQIDNWLMGKEKLPDFRIISSYIKSSSRLKEISDLLQKDDSYKHIRQRCNDYTHSNFYKNLLINDSEISLENSRLLALEEFSEDLDHIFIQHLAYMFYLNDAYLMSTNYMDAVDLGLNPEKGSEYYVAPIIQKIFDETIKARRPDIAETIKQRTTMMLE